MSLMNKGKKRGKRAWREWKVLSLRFEGSLFFIFWTVSIFCRISKGDSDGSIEDIAWHVRTDEDVYAGVVRRKVI
ncbi:hypothetical protein TNCV_2678711 [Trichonephila clavipes]|nr:hypothetical protein TNCV_2678711 [Trichonephila clavipes]